MADAEHAGALTAPRRLPRPIAVRLADLRRHYAALRHAMGALGDDFTAEALRAAIGSEDPDELALAYAIERPFELLDNYIVELAAAGLVEAGAIAAGDEPRSGIETLRLLRDGGVISKERCRRLERIHRARTELQHEYPDVKSDALHEAVTALVEELPGFLRDYARWLRSLGFGQA